MSEREYRRQFGPMEGLLSEGNRNQSMERLAQIGQMVALVMHEVRNPLQNIQLSLDILRMELREQNGAMETLRDISRSVEMLKSIAQEILDYSKTPGLRYAAWSLHEVVERALRMLTGKFRNINVSLNLREGEEEVCLDAEKMIRVLVNVVTNAVEAMPDGGDLRIYSEFRQEDKRSLVSLSISDTGCGITEEDLDRIQLPFVTTKPGGVGLGLPICRKIIEEHHGTLRITSKLNHGTIVEIILPVHDTSEDRIAEETALERGEVLVA